MKTFKRAPATHRAEQGFTLMEMLVVLVVIGLIAAVAIPQVMKMLGSAKHKAARIQLETLNNSLNAYQLDMGGYPTTAQGLQVLWKDDGSTDWAGPYVRREKQLLDPWGHVFIYRAPGKAAAYELISLGADGQEGGRGDDADLAAD
jgi:general secretion pathway protein G